MTQRQILRTIENETCVILEVDNLTLWHGLTMKVKEARLVMREVAMNFSVTVEEWGRWVPWGGKYDCDRKNHHAALGFAPKRSPLYAALCEAVERRIEAFYAAPYVRVGIPKSAGMERNPTGSYRRAGIDMR